MKFKKQILKNGLRIITVPMSGTKAVTVLVSVATGSKYENQSNNGISHFLEHMFFKGTKKHPNTLAITEALDRVGGAYNAFTSEEHTGYWAKVDYKHLDLALDVISDIFLNSKLEKQEIEKEKGVICEEINMYQDTPMQYVGILFNKLLYNNQPAGWPILGNKDNILKFQKKDFTDYLKNHYIAKNTVICLAGNIENNISKYFKNIKTGKTKNKIKTQEQQTKPETLVFHKNTDQTHLCLGVRAYDLFHQDRYALAVLGVLLGGMMSSRLWIQIREKQGLAYYIQTQVENQTDTGYLVTQAGVDHNKIDKAIKLILQEYINLKNKKISQKELSKVKECIKGRMILKLESSDAMASWICTQEVLTKNILTLEKIFAKIDAVTTEDVQRVAQDIFKNQKLNLAVICPKNLTFQPKIFLE